MDRFLRDLRFAARRLARTPVFTLVAVLSLGLGIGANTAVFSVLNGIFFRDTGMREPDRIVDIYRSRAPGDYGSLTLDWLRDIQDGTTGVLDDPSGIYHWLGRVEQGGVSHRVTGIVVAGHYFRAIGVSPAQGRGFTTEELTEEGAHPVVVIADGFWRDVLSADPDAVGAEIRLNGRPYTVIGIMPPDYRGKVPGIVPDLWTPMTNREHLAPGAGRSDNLFGTARLADGVTFQQARAAVQALGQRMDRERVQETGTANRFGLTVVPFQDTIFHPDLDGFIKAVAALLMVMVGLVLLVACTNLASFLLARATERRRELAVRLALGADRGLVIRQLLTESTALGLAGGAVGLGAGYAMSRALLSIKPPIGFPVTVDAGFDLRVFGFTVALSLVAGVLFGVLPALKAARTSVSVTLRDEAGSVTGGRRTLNARGALVVVQVAISLVLLMSAGLFARSLARASTLDMGFDRGPAAIMEIDARSSGYEDNDQLRGLYADLLATVRATPGVNRAAITDKLPLSLGVTRRTITVPGVAPPPGRDNFLLDRAAVSPGYFEAMGIHVAAGRAFTSGDDAASETVAILSRSAARRFWGDDDAAGRIIHFDPDPDPVRVVGVVDDVRITSLTGEASPYLYVPYLQTPASQLRIVARGADPALLLTRLRTAVRDVDPDLFIVDARTMSEHLGLVLYLPRMGATLLLVLGAMALALALMGLYGIVSYNVASRTREVGIRAALGATPREVVALLMRGGFVLVAVGGAIGLLLALAAARVIQRFLVGVSAHDPLTFTFVLTAMVVAAGLAAWLPARHASRIDPVEALRTE